MPTQLHVTEIFTDSPFRIAVSGAVLKMQESGKLTEIKTKWWKEKNNVNCDVSESLKTS